MKSNSLLLIVLYFFIAFFCALGAVGSSFQAERYGGTAALVPLFMRLATLLVLAGLTHGFLLVLLPRPEAQEKGEADAR